MLLFLEFYETFDFNFQICKAQHGLRCNLSTAIIVKKSARFMYLSTHGLKSFAYADRIILLYVIIFNKEFCHLF